MLGAGVTVNGSPLLTPPPEVVTTTLPVVAPAGTVAVMLPALHALTVAAVPLKVTPPVPCDVPKLVPAMTIDDPTAPVLGARLLMTRRTVNVTPVLAPLGVVTTTFPVAALQDVTGAAVPLKVTLLVPCDAPKLEPAMTTEVPAAPVLGVRLVIAGVTLNVTLLLTPPEVVTTTLPVVAPDGTVAVMLPTLQAVTAAVVALKVTLPVPCVVPKPEPAMTMDEPTGPALGVRLLITGVTVNATPLLDPPEVVTTRLPVVAPPGTVAVMLPTLQAVTVAVAPLKVTLLVP